MKQPLWILNSALFLLIIFIFIFIIFSRVTVLERESIEPDASRLKVAKEVSKINIKKIYEYDLFGTYKKEFRVSKAPEPFRPLPAPPLPAPVEIPKTVGPKFLDPLNIALKGIMVISSGNNNIAIIQDNKTKRESSYKVGDSIEDAQLIRIFNNKVIFVRSNGQQEVFYLREQDAKSDPAFLNIDDWNGLVKKISPNNYFVSPLIFLKKVKNLAQFIDLLDLTSAYKKGKGVGCRVGSMIQNSLGSKLGLKEGDIILSINKNPATSTKNRLKIYKDVTSLKEGGDIVVKLQRGRSIYTLNYKLKEFKLSNEKSGAIKGIVSMSPEQIKEEKRKMLERKHKFASSEKDIMMIEKQNILHRGRMPIGRKKHKLAE